MDALSIEIEGQTLRPRADKTLHWPARRTLFVADLHLGKSARFRAAGVPAPEGTTAATLARLGRALDDTRAERLVVLGDLVDAHHAAAGPTRESVATFFQSRTALDTLLIPGNHDARAGALPDDWSISLGSSSVDDPPFSYQHDPNDGGETSGYLLSGHVHPAATLSGPKRRARLPCFWFGARRAVLPAFGDFTGLHPIRPSAGDAVFLITPIGLCRAPTFVTPRRTRAAR